MKKILISYVFHQKNDFSDFRNFILSLKKYPPPNYIILCITVKGITPLVKNRMKKLLKDLDFKFEINFHQFPDIGYGIGTNYLINQIYSPDVIILMTATSEFKHRDWFKYLITPLKDKNIGLVGSMSSFESRNTNFYELAEVLIKNKFRIQLTKIQRQTAISKNVNIKKQLFNFGENDGVIVKLFVYLIFKIFQARLFSLEYRSQIHKYPKFPNPHLRTTGLAIKGDVFEKLVQKIPMSKEEEFVLESGYQGISARARRLGYNLIVCTELGEYFDIRDPRACQTFRSTSSKSIIIDKYVRYFDELTMERRAALEFLMTANRKSSFLEPTSSKV